MDGAVEALERFYENELVCMSWIVCGDDEEAQQMTAILRGKWHTVTLVTEHLLDDERNIAEAIVRDASKMVICSYAVWQRMEECFEIQVLPKIDLLAFGNVDKGTMQYMIRQLQSAIQRGFGHKDKDIRILQLVEENM